MEKKKNPLIKISKNGKERGASLVEYGLLVALIAVVGIPAVRAVGANLNDKFDQAREGIAGSTEVSNCMDSPFDPCP